MELTNENKILVLIIFYILCVLIKCNQFYLFLIKIKNYGRTFVFPKIFIVFLFHFSYEGEFIKLGYLWD